MASDVEARQLAIVKNATIYRVGNGTSVKVASGDLTVVQLPKVLAQAAATASTCSAATAAATTPKLQSSSSSTTPPATAVDAGTGAGGGAGGGAGAASGSASDESGAQTAAVAEGEEGQKNGAEHLVFLMLGTFSYPLVSQPALQADATRFVLPSDGFSWAVAAETAEATAPLQRALKKHTRLYDMATGTRLEYTDADAAADDASWGTYLATNVQDGAEWAAGAIVSGASWLGSSIAAGASWVKSYIEPATDETAVAVSDGTQTALDRAKGITGTAVTITSTVVEAVTTTATALGSWAVDKFSTTSYGQSIGEAADTDTGKGVKAVGLAGISAAGTLLVSMEQAARTVLSSTATATTEIVDHAYGPEAGKATASTLEVAGNVGEAAWNVKQMGSKVLIGKTAATIAKDKLEEEAGAAAAAGAGAGSQAREEGEGEAEADDGEAVSYYSNAAGRRVSYTTSSGAGSSSKERR